MRVVAAQQKCDDKNGIQNISNIVNILRSDVGNADTERSD